MEPKKNVPLHTRNYGVQWDKRNSNFSTYFLKNAPNPGMIWNQKKMSHCTPEIWCAVGQKKSNISTQFLKNAPSPEMIWNQKKCPTAHFEIWCAVGTIEFKFFKLLVEKCSKPRN